MGSLLRFDTADRGRSRNRISSDGASFGIVTELVRRDAVPKGDLDARSGHRGVIRIGERVLISRVERVPAVGDLIQGEIPGIVERVRITGNGRISIFARPDPTAQA